MSPYSLFFYLYTGIVLGTCVDPSFLQNGESTPVGCVVCIPRGASITLDCTVIGDPPITYEWTDSSGVVLNNPKLTVSREDNYTCVVENPDNPMVSTTSTLICKFRDIYLYVICYLFSCMHIQCLTYQVANMKMLIILRS